MILTFLILLDGGKSRISLAKLTESQIALGSLVWAKYSVRFLLKINILPSGPAIEAGYQFSSYRLRYLYKLVDAEQWQVDLGATLFLRDARIKLSQNGEAHARGEADGDAGYNSFHHLWTLCHAVVVV